MKKLICTKSSDQQVVQTGDQVHYKSNSKQTSIYKAFLMEYQAIKDLSRVESSDQGKIFVN